MKELTRLKFSEMKVFGLKLNKITSSIYLAFFYSPKTSDKLFFERLNQNLEIALYPQFCFFVRDEHKLMPVSVLYIY